MGKTKAPYQKSPIGCGGYITWEAHVKAYKEYAKQYGTMQSAERIAERGGFGDNELDKFFPDWRNHIVS